MTLNTKSILKASAVYSSLAVLIGGAWAFGDTTGYRPWLKLEQNEFTQKQFQMVMDQTQQNTLALAKNEFDLLWGKRKFGELAFEEKILLCKDAQILNYAVTDEQGSLICTNDGQPVFSVRSSVK